MELSTEVSGATVAQVVLSHEEGDDEIALDDDWVLSISKRRHLEPKKLRGSAMARSCSIHRVPHHLRQHDPSAYEPQAISIGPFHYRKRSTRLQAMEEHKWRYLHDILARSSTGCATNVDSTDATLKKYLKRVKKLEKQARLCYSEDFDYLTSNDFIEMLLLDGCFLIEYLTRVWTREVHQTFSSDPLVEDLSWQASIRCDLTLLENQIPFFIIQNLYELMTADAFSTPRVSLEDLLLRFYQLRLGARFNHPIQHILHLYHTVFYNGAIMGTREATLNVPVTLIPSATKLKDAGITFKKSNGCFGDIKFKKGMLQIPPWVITEKNSAISTNVLAFEQNYRFCSKYFTTWVIFMDCLINTTEDVQILIDAGIIESWLGSNEDVAAFFNKLGRDLMIIRNDFFLRPIFDEINGYCGHKWPKLRAILVHDYFKNPWAIVSFVAAVILLLLTMAQTFFTSFPTFAYGN